MEKLAIDGGKPVRGQFLGFGRPDLGEAEIDEVEQTLRSGWITIGPRVQKFQEMFGEYIGCKQAVAVSSCTAALHLSLVMENIGRGDEVITTPMTFAATANVIEMTGADTVFVDCEKETMNIDPDKIEGAITPKTKAIIPVHFAGRSCEMDAISKLAKRHNLAVIEDAAHALEATYHKKKIGTISRYTCFSFYANKNLTTGEGGMLTTNDDKTAERAKILSNHGLSSGAWTRHATKKMHSHLVEEAGYKYYMTDVPAAIGIRQMPSIGRKLKRRKELWDYYTKELKGLPLIPPAPPGEDSVHAMHMYNVLLRLDELKADRNTIVAAIKAENIGAGIHYISLHAQPYYKNKYQLNEVQFPSSQFISERTMTLTLSPATSDRDAEDVVKGVEKVLQHYAK